MSTLIYFLFFGFFIFCVKPKKLLKISLRLHSDKISNVIASTWGQWSVSHQGRKLGLILAPPWGRYQCRAPVNWYNVAACIAAVICPCCRFHFPPLIKNKIPDATMAIVSMLAFSISLQTEHWLSSPSVSSVADQVTLTKLPPRPPENLSARRLSPGAATRQRRRMAESRSVDPARPSRGSFVLHAELTWPPPLLPLQPPTHANAAEGQLTPADPCYPHRPFTPDTRSFRLNESH